MLVDGSLLMGRVLSISDESCEVSGHFGLIAVPRPLVRAALINALPVDGYQESFVRQALEAVGGDDQIVRIDGDRVDGTLRTSGDGLVLRRGARDVVEITIGEQVRSEPVEHLRGIIFSPLLTPLVTAARDEVLMGLADGSRLAVRRVDGEPGEGWRVRLVCGLELAPRNDWFRLSEISCLSYGRVRGDGDVVRLNRREPLRVRTIPLVGPAVVTEPKGQGGGAGEASTWLPSWRDGTWYPEAIEAAVGSQVLYRGSNAPQRFRAAAGVADARFAADARGGAAADDGVAAPAVRFRVRVVTPDGIQPIWDSGPVVPGEPLMWVDQALPPAAAVILEVERISAGSDGLRALWIDPVLTGP